MCVFGHLQLNNQLIPLGDQCVGDDDSRRQNDARNIDDQEWDCDVDNNGKIKL